MPRFDDFTQQEIKTMHTALEWSQSEFYDPGHTESDRETLQALIAETKAKLKPERRTFAATTRRTMQARPAEEEKAPAKMAPEPEAAYDRGGHPIIRYQDGTVERITGDKPTRKVTDKPETAPGEYTGFLYLECAHCGDIHAFCAKKPMRSYRCGKCGGRTPLIDMHRLHVRCECGGSFNYQTNIVTQQMDVACFRCGAPVAVEWSDRWKKYVPITQGSGFGRRKKK